MSQQVALNCSNKVLVCMWTDLKKNNESTSCHELFKVLICVWTDKQKTTQKTTTMSQQVALNCSNKVLISVWTDEKWVHKLQLHKLSVVYGSDSLRATNTADLAQSSLFTEMQDHA